MTLSRPNLFYRTEVKILRGPSYAVNSLFFKTIINNMSSLWPSIILHMKEVRTCNTWKKLTLARRASFLQRHVLTLTASMTCSDVRLLNVMLPFARVPLYPQ